MLPAVRVASAGRGDGTSSIDQPSASRRLLQQTQQQTHAASTHSKSALLTSLPSIVPQHAPPSEAGKRVGGSASASARRRAEAAAAAAAIDAAAIDAAADTDTDADVALDSGLSLLAPPSTPPRLQLVDARLEGTVEESVVDSSARWSQLGGEGINSILASPLSAQEVALNALADPSRRSKKRAMSAEERLARDAHRALDVSRLPGVPRVDVQLGVSALGDPPRLLLLEFANNSPVILPSASDPLVHSPLSRVEGEARWRVRLASELEARVDRWARASAEEPHSIEERYLTEMVDRDLFTVTPRTGRLAPGERLTLRITYNPAFVGAHVMPLLMQVSGGHHFTLVLYAHTMHALPPLFSMLHLPQLKQGEERNEADPDKSESHSQQKSEEESKEQPSDVFSVPRASLSPFLPSPLPPVHVHELHSVPLGLGSDEAPVQTLVLYNYSPHALRFRIDLSSLRAAREQHHGVDVLSVMDPATGRAAAGESVEGVVAAMSQGVLRLVFRPLEEREYSVPLALRVWADGGMNETDAAEQAVLVRGRGVLPRQWALSSFPAPLSRASQQLVSVPGQLLHLSCEEVHFGDVLLFSRSSRVLTLRASVDTARPVEFAFVHGLRLPRHKWDESLRAARRVRAQLHGEDEQDDDEIEPLDDEAEADGGESQFDPLESVHVCFTPRFGVLQPGETRLVRVDLHAGSRPLVLERDVRLFVRALEPEEAQLQTQGAEAATLADAMERVHLDSSASGSMGATQQYSALGPRAAQPQPPAAAANGGVPMDCYGFQRTPSSTLAQRRPVSSSVPHPRRQVGMHVHVRESRLVESVTGVGAALGGADVRVDYPPRQSPPLTSQSLRARESGSKAGESVAPEQFAFVAATMANLHSVPSRATWFRDANNAAMQRLQNRAAAVQHLFLRARILPLATMQCDATLRRKHAASNPASAAPPQLQSPLPQQLRTELTAAESDVAARFFVPPVDVGTGASVASAASPPVARNPASLPEVESALESLLRSALCSPASSDTLSSLHTQPVPLFADLLASDSDSATSPSSSLSPGPHPPSTSTAATPNPSLPACGAHFQLLSESLLSDALLSLLAEAADPRARFSLDQPLPKSVVMQQTEAANRSSRRQAAEDTQRQ